ncbi:MAG: potassium transporter TrkG, partial [Thermoguttaceae bacterium]|nr:potassium transporter TrkG [Thermoguttaceae bacterium]
LPWLEAIWHSIFTAVSAFCNAGFTLTSDNLIAYNSNPVVLYTVSSLIVLGGLAPATSLLIPAWISARPVPVAARLVLETTLLLLVGGTVAIMAFEWNGILSGLSIADKVHNAWFQSATLRTAGFNSVPLEQIKDPTLFTMVALMFVGGSPGGTAGGVKTTTMAILVLTFLAVIRHRDEVIVRRRRISVQTVYRAVATFLAGLVVWFLFVLCLQVTQSISARQVVFEITSALGTVGLTIGATPQLDEIGKLIVMGAMFFGRIGPVTLFMYMAPRKPTEFSEYPDLKINMS